jgi:hypothetical protein
MIGKKQGGFYPHDDLLLGYFQGQVAQMVVEQKQTKTLIFQDEKTIYAPRSSRGRL